MMLLFGLPVRQLRSGDGLQFRRNQVPGVSLDVCFEKLGTKGYVVCAVPLNFDAGLVGQVFESFLSFHSLPRSKRHLVLNKHEGGQMVHENGAANILIRLGFFASGVGKASGNGREVLVKGHTGSGSEMTLTKMLLRRV